MRLPNLLASKNGRLAAFFLLYVTEGIPLGFAATAVATRLRRLDVGPAEIGAFVGSFYLPWAFKWAFGPVIDVFASDWLGRRRGWILITQVLMALTLLSTVMLDLPQQLGLFTMILLVHNTFGAMQDVAIDALACSTLQEDPCANGLRAPSWRRPAARCARSRLTRSVHSLEATVRLAVCCSPCCLQVP
ncbi:MAG: hypothetical protein WCH60_05670 [Burkholderiales bacterium]